MGFLDGLIPWDLIHNQREHDTEQDRISNEEFVWNEEMADMHNTNEIGRQSSFLAGMVDPEANAYNSYQDQTYGQDTQRQIDRVKSTAEQLGMSPWELNNGSAATPAPSGDFLSGKTKNTSDADPSGQMIAMKQMETQKDIAAMNNTTALQQTAMQTGNSRYLAEDTPQARAGVALTKQQEQNGKAQQLLTDAETAMKTNQNIAAVRSSLMDTAQAFFNMQPKMTFTGNAEAAFNKGKFIGPEGSVSGTVQYEVRNNWDKLTSKAGDKNAFYNEWNGLSEDAFASVMNAVKDSIKNASDFIKDQPQGTDRYLGTNSRPNGRPVDNYATEGAD